MSLQELDARVIAMDMPGFGLTERPKGCLTGYDAEKALHNLIDALAMHEG